MTKQTASIQVIDRSARLMEAIAGANRPASLKILSAETGLHPSTAFRILASLIDIGFVERDSAGHYFIGRKIRHLSNSVRRGVDIREEARDIMENLRDEIGETVNLTVREGDEVIYIERVSPNRMMRVEQVIGSRAPLHVTAVGKLMLGELGNTFIRAYSKRSGLKAYTTHTLASLEALTKGVQDAMVTGYAFDNEEAEIGVGCIGVLIHDKNDNVVAGLSISAPIERRKNEWAGLLKKAAKTVAERL
ncbi:MAG: IclR family transcriptional regulator [Gammaproteobacteria bacterium]|nr:IclR family transcriptional regulator [Gammaproteobacteria bacterium]MDH5803163.1 IclR family transcriptional regulator [Gammaproteobacteria bacterium]